MKRFLHTLFACGLVAVLGCCLAISTPHAASIDSEGETITGTLIQEIRQWAKTQCGENAALACITGKTQAVAKQVFRLAWNTPGVECPVYNAPACAEDEEAVPNPPRSDGCGSGFSCRKTETAGSLCPQYQLPVCMEGQVVAYRRGVPGCGNVPYCAPANSSLGNHDRPTPMTGTVGQGRTNTVTRGSEGSPRQSLNVGGITGSNSVGGQGSSRGNAIGSPSGRPLDFTGNANSAGRVGGEGFQIITQPMIGGGPDGADGPIRTHVCPMVAALNPTCAPGQELYDPQPQNPCKQTYPWACRQAQPPAMDDPFGNGGGGGV